MILQAGKDVVYVPTSSNFDPSTRLFENNKLQEFESIFQSVNTNHNRMKSVDQVEKENKELKNFLENPI